MLRNQGYKTYLEDNTIHWGYEKLTVLESLAEKDSVFILWYLEKTAPRYACVLWFCAIFK